MGPAMGRPSRSTGLAVAQEPGGLIRMRAVKMTRVRMALRDAFKVNAGNAAHPRHVISNVESQRDVAVICREE
jgi:hypothetical protein